MAEIGRLCVIGVGLIGGSLIRALRDAGAVGEVIGCSRHEANLRVALELGVIDRLKTDPALAVQDADMVVVAVPVGCVEEVFRRIDGHLKPDAVLTDVGSTKGSVVKAARNAFGAVPPSFVPGHPIAGTEKSGVEASFSELFQGRRVILAPLPETDPVAIGRVRGMWERCGARVEETTVQHHDEVLAATSHLPHLLAYALVDSLAQMEEKSEIFRYAAGGFRDFTRIASSDPAMWHDICLANREALLGMMDRFETDLQLIRRAIASGDGEYLLKVFTRAKAARDTFVDGNGE